MWRQDILLYKVDFRSDILPYHTQIDWSVFILVLPAVARSLTPQVVALFQLVAYHSYLLTFYSVIVNSRVVVGAHSMLFLNQDAFWNNF
ncbi:hypothetical protein BST61_g7305 [Cercospora zeina]